ncbi:MAG: cupin-like domain-containing protein [Cellulomonas sp.]|nr:cupin-like domain-containing protein [Cellulomonas sp.]
MNGVGAGRSTDRPALARLVAVAADAFARDHWGRAPLLTPAAELGGGFADLFSLDAVDELVSRRALRTPFVRMAKDGEVLPPARYTAPGGYGAEVGDQVASAKVLQEVADGATLVLQGLHRTWEPIAELTRHLAAELGHPCQVNAYVTPAQSRGFDPHYDVHDVFVLQVHGEKHWRIHDPVHPDPLRSQPWSDHRDAVAQRATERPAIDETFRPGDALYLPRGWIHSATALGGISIHLTIGVSSYTRYDVVQEVLARVAASPELRGSLPFGLDLDDPAAATPVVEQALAELVTVLEKAQADPATAEGVRRALAARLARDVPAAPVRPLATVDALSRFGVDDVVVLRGGLHPRLVVDGGSVVLRLPRSAVTLPVAAHPALQALLTGTPVRVGDLPDLDAESAVVVARRLVREGVLVPVGA